MSDDGENIGGKAGAPKPFFSGGAGDSTTSYGGMNLDAGAQIGPFKVLGVLGEGGYGIVYLAQQEEPIRRRVALKIVKPGMDSKQVIARFEAERQALALLDHPNIAHVYDAGTTDRGRPYFAMEYIEGNCITEYCDTERLAIKERLRLFLQVCHAIQHAHQKGIIHRDIKPSNILVSAEDGEALVKVIDFGVAKALTQSLTDKTLYTEQGQFVGTPDYMSPEQAELDAHHVDTRSDVYSLGVVLYELLSGVLPFDPQELRAGGISHIRTVIQGQEPTTPSTRLTSLGEDAQRIAERRQTDPQTLARSLRRELEWIPLKAMRKDKARRYESVSELADDIESYLRGAPLLAGPESATYRIRKFIQRHWGALAAGFLIAATLVAGTTISSLMYLRSEKSRSDEAAQRAVAETERDRAEAAEQEAERRLVDLYEEKGRECLRAERLDEALVFLSEAYQLDSERTSLAFLLAACARQHSDPAINDIARSIPWNFGYDAPRELSFATSPQREYVAFLDQERDLITVFDTEDGERVLQVPMEKATAMAFTPDGRHLVVKSEEETSEQILSVLKLESGELIASIKRRNTDVEQLCRVFEGQFPDRQQLDGVYGSILVDKMGEWFAFVDTPEVQGVTRFEVKLWDFRARKLHKAEALDSPLVMFGPRSGDVYGHWKLNALDLQRQYWVWNVPTLDRSGGWHWYTDFGRFGPDRGGRFYTVDARGVRLFHRAGNQMVRRCSDAAGAGFSPDGRTFITRKRATSSETFAAVKPLLPASLWKAETGDHIGDVTGTEIRNWHFTLDSALVITEHKGGHITVWRTIDGQLYLRMSPGQDLRVTDISSDGVWMIVRSMDEPPGIYIWNIETREAYGPFREHTLSADVTVDFVQSDVDRIFEHSMARPVDLIRFSKDDSALITREGLRPLTRVMLPPDELSCLIQASISLRLTAGRIGPATKREMLVARHHYLRSSKGAQDAQAIHAALEAAIYFVEADDLPKAAELTHAVCTSGRSIGRPLASEVRQVKRKLHTALCAKADLKARRRQYKAAILCYESALKLLPEDPCTLNALAWLQATRVEPRVRNIASALAHARKACELTDWNYWEYLSTYAVVYAGAGQFSQAVKLQEKANELLPLDKRQRWQANFAQRLALFRSNEPYDEKAFRDLPTENLIGWWTFDEGRGQVVHDLSGNRYDCVFEGDPKWRPGKTGFALQSDLDDFASCICAGAFNLRDAITVASWLRIGDIPDTEDWTVPLSNGAGGWSIGYQPEIRKFCFSCTDLRTPKDDARPGFVQSKQAVNKGQWHHVAAVYDGRTMCLYLDGVLDSQAPATGLIRPERNLWLGSGYGCHFFGLLDDVRIYNSALDSNAIADLYRAGNDRAPSGLFVRAGEVPADVCTDEAVKLHAAVFQYGDMPLSQTSEVRWAVSQGPAAVEFGPAETALDPCAVFPEPGLYELVLTARAATMESCDALAIMVYPQGHDGLIAHYDFESGDTRDSTGYGPAGILIGGASIVEDPARGSSLSLDGDGDYVDCGDDARYQLSDKITVAVWAKSDGFDGDRQSILGKGDLAWTLHRHRTSETVRFACFDLQRENEWLGAAGETKVDDDCWHHLVGTYDGRIICVYIDGKQEGVTEAPGRLGINQASVVVGENLEASKRGLTGLIDDVRIYNRALSPEEVTRLYEETK